MTFSRIKKFCRKYYGYIVLFVLMWFTSNNWLQVAIVQGDSMYPTYKNGQLLLVNKIADIYSVGDIIAFEAEELNCVLIKRIVAMPGDKVQIVNGTLLVNDVPSEHQIKNSIIDYAGIAETTIVLAEDEYFVLGDNYGQSKDSRYTEVNVILKEKIIGRICNGLGTR